jgi:hypothetical protein
MWKFKWLYARLCYIHWIMLDLLNRPSFLDLKPLHMGKIGPYYSHIIVCSWGRPPTQKKAEISCNWPQRELAQPLGVKLPSIYFSITASSSSWLCKVLHRLCSSYQGICPQLLRTVKSVWTSSLQMHDTNRMLLHLFLLNLRFVCDGVHNIIQPYNWVRFLY